MMRIRSESLNRDELIKELASDMAGALVVFEGWVRDHNQGKKVKSLEYQVYKELALKEGQKIINEAKAKFNLHGVNVVHREGHLKLGEMAIFIGVTSSHRDDAFKAARYIIDEIKHRLPVWKKEHYVEENAEWVFCKDHHHHIHFEENAYYKNQSTLIDQAKFKKSKVLVVGAGGLGCPTLMNLAASGVGKITIVDSDRIHLSNIHRQQLYDPNLVGEKKVVVAKKRLTQLNPFIQIDAVDMRIDSQNALSIIKDHDLIIDCTDNMQTKYLLHDACFKLQLPLISASVYKHEGQIRTFLPRSKYGCLRCHVKQTPQDSFLGNCNDLGVLSSTTSVLGSMQASEALFFIQQGHNETLEKTLLVDLSGLTQIKITNTQVHGCRVCLGEVTLSMDDDFEISKDDLDRGDFQILDIRNLKDNELEPYKGSLKKTVLYCHKGVRSKALVRSLRLAGYAHFYSLQGGACSL